VAGHSGLRGRVAVAFPMIEALDKRVATERIVF
jgi:hypothetical protein